MSGSGAAYSTQTQSDAQYIPVAQGKIEYYRLGTGTPIVLIPGYATDVSSWNRDFLATLAEQHELIVMNNRGVGGSVVESSRYESRDLANDVFQVIQNLRLKKPAVLGISMGGMIAQHVAAMHPNDVGHLILINTIIAGHQSVRPNPEMEKNLLNVPSSDLGFYCFAIQTFFPPSWRISMAYSLIVDRFQPKNLHTMNRTAIKPQQQHLVLNWLEDNETAKMIAQLKMPTLILNGGADIVLPPVNSSILAQVIPHATLIRWKDGGHAMIYQYPKQNAQAINAFINKVH